MHFGGEKIKAVIERDVIVRKGSGVIITEKGNSGRDATETLV